MQTGIIDNQIIVRLRSSHGVLLTATPLGRTINPILCRTGMHVLLYATWTNAPPLRKIPRRRGFIGIQPVIRLAFTVRGSVTDNSVSNIHAGLQHDPKPLLIAVTPLYPAPIPLSDRGHAILTSFTLPSGTTPYFLS